MTRVRLKDAIPVIGGILYEVELNRSRWQEEEIKTKRHRSDRPYNGKASEAQTMQRQRFKEAAAYAKAALAEPQVRLRYERKARKQNKRAWDLAVSDYFKGKDLLKKREK